MRQRFGAQRTLTFQHERLLMFDCDVQHAPREHREGVVERSTKHLPEVRQMRVAREQRALDDDVDERVRSGPDERDDIRRHDGDADGARERRISAQQIAVERPKNEARVEQPHDRHRALGGDHERDRVEPDARPAHRHGEGRPAGELKAPE